MRVAFITQWWGSSPDGVIAGIAQTLQGEGAWVDVIAGRMGLDGTLSGPKWRWRDRKTWRGSTVTTYPFYYSHDGSAARRMLTYGSFATTSALAAADLRGYDVALVYGSPVTAAAAAMVGKMRFGVPYVLNVQDVWPDSIFATGFLESGFARTSAERAVGGFVDRAYRRSAGVVAISPGMRELLVSRGVPSDKAHYFYNWVADEEAVVPVDIPARRAGEPLHLMYAGSIGFAQSLDNVLDALASLPAGVASLTLVGDGPAVESLRRRTAELNLNSVDFTGVVPRSQVPQLQSTAHLHLISLADQNLFRNTIPSKLQALAAHGAPVLCTAPGEVADIVVSNGMGLSAPPGDPRSLAETIRRAARLTDAELQEMGANGRTMYSTQMSRSIGAKKLAGILEDAARTRTRRR